jgi:hypothetical protein
LTAGAIAIRKGQTIMVIPNAGPTGTVTQNKAIVTNVNTSTGTIDVAFYEASGITNGNVC